MKTFERLIPIFPKAELIFLQGWGEPLMNPNFLKMLSLVKNSGAKAGTSTNGMLLDDDMIKRLVKSEIDIIAFSLVGAASGNDTVRKGANFDTIIRNIRKFKEIKKNLHRDKPNLHIAYLLLKSGLDKLAELSDTLKDCNINQIVVSTLDFIPDKALENETIRPKDLSEYDELKKYLDTIAKSSKQRGIGLHYHLHHPVERQKTCTENIQRAFFVSSNGDIAPCVFAGLPVSKAEYYINNRPQKYRPLTFGNINEKSLPRIWFRKGYETFRESFEKGKPDYICHDCPKLYMT